MKTQPSQPNQPNTDSEVKFEQQSGWATFLCVLGFILLLLSVVLFLLWMSNEMKGNEYIFGIVSLVSGINSFFIAFLVDVFTDIRWFLKLMVDKNK